MYSLVVKPKADKLFKKMGKKNRITLEIIRKKINEIIKNPKAYKPLRAPLQYLRRVHIQKSFVLLFSIDEEKKVVIIHNYKHHDDAYKK